MKPNEPRIRFAKSALAKVTELSRTSMAIGLETTGMIVGKKTKRGIDLLHVIEPGPNATRTAVFCEPDYVFQAQELVTLRKNDPNLVIVGGWHAHDLLGLSSGDKGTILSVCQSANDFLAVVVCGKSAQKVMVFGVEDGRPIEKDWRPFRPRAKRAAADLRRIAKLVPINSLRKKKVLVVGSGTGGSLVARYLARSGVGHLGCADAEVVEALNLPRHIAGLSQLGMPKVDVIEQDVHAFDPTITVEKHVQNIDASSADRFKEIVSRYDLVVACSGTAEGNRIINELCREAGVPIVFAGAFARGMGGYAFQVIQKTENPPCYNCIFDVAKSVVEDSNASSNHQRKRYGFTEFDLHAQQGLYADISFIALFQIKMAILTLLDGAEHGLPPLPGNFVAWDATTMNARWANVTKREGCAVCDPQGWERMRSDAAPTVDLSAALSSENSNVPL